MNTTTRSSHFPAGRASLHRFRLALLAAAALVIGGGAAAAAPAPAPAGKTGLSNRWLFIVETSGSMEERAPGIQRIIQGLLANGAGDQMRSGDTIGLWTYTDQVLPSQFPLQTWSPENASVIADRMNSYVKSQPFEKKGRFERVLPDVQKLITNSQFITVVLISDGAEKMRGTPFDKQINAAYDTWRKEQNKSLIPFVTILRADHGKITRAAVTAPPWPLEMPPLPPELTNRPPVETAAPAPPARPTTRQPPPAAAPRPAPTAKPLIISGKKNTPDNSSESEWVITNLPPSSAGSTNK
ncbi:MAG: hypothetical protein U1F98_03670 [Verrucomicrobiota bacterium]